MSTSIHKTNTDIKGEIDSNTIIVGDFNTSLTLMERSSIQKINKVSRQETCTVYVRPQVPSWSPEGVKAPSRSGLRNPGK